jgi:hypothetical protein
VLREKNRYAGAGLIAFCCFLVVAACIAYGVYSTQVH